MVRIVSHDPGWATAFEMEAGRLARALGEAAAYVSGKDGFVKHHERRALR